MNAQTPARAARPATIIEQKINLAAPAPAERAATAIRQHWLNRRWIGRLL